MNRRFSVEQIIRMIKEYEAGVNPLLLPGAFAFQFL